MYCIVKSLQETDGFGGVLVNVEWYERDPEEEPLLSPVLVDQFILPAPDTAHVTDTMLDAALNRRRPEVEKMTAPTPTPPAAVRAMLGRARVVPGVGQGRTQAVAEVKAMRAEAERLARLRAEQQKSPPPVEQPPIKVQGGSRG